MNKRTGISSHQSDSNINSQFQLDPSNSSSSSTSSNYSPAIKITKSNSNSTLSLYNSMSSHSNLINASHTNMNTILSTIHKKRYNLYIMILLFFLLFCYFLTFLFSSDTKDINLYKYKKPISVHSISQIFSYNLYNNDFIEPWFANDIYFQESLLFDKTSDESLINQCNLEESSLLITINSVEANMLSHHGGTSQWYHFYQRILPMMSQAHDEIWGISARKKYQSFDDIYIVFEEEDAVNQLNPFGRFILTHLLTGGKYPRIHLGYYNVKSIQINKKQIMIPINNIKILFSIDLKHQSLNDLFVQSIPFNKLRSNNNNIPICYQHVLHVPLLSYRQKFLWFVNTQNLTIFHESYKAMCQIKDPWYEVALSLPTTELVNIHDDYDLTLYNRKFRHDPSPFNNLKTNDVEDKQNEVTNIAKIMHYRTSTSLINKNTNTNHINENEKKLKILIYQRNLKRKIKDVYQIGKSISEELKNYDSSYQLHHSMSNNKSNIFITSQWDVKILEHHDQHPPCLLIHDISSTTALLTNHGFQSILLLYQPMNSIFAEIHTFLMFIPEFYGELQLSLRRRYEQQYTRSFLVEESKSDSMILNLLLFLGIQTSESCVNYKYCRSISKMQDVKISKDFIRRFVLYLKTHFIREIDAE